jgi:hydrophobe/amphiphile efflux-1 (HAE1) family protein
MKNMSAWAIRHPISPVVMFVVLTFVGIVAFIRLPINLNPDITFPMINVSVSQPGAAPTEIETQIMQKVEGSIASVTGVRNITSRAIEGQALIFVEFQIGTPVDRALNDVRDAVSKVRSELPEGIQEPVVQRVDVEGGAIAYYAVATTQMTPEELSWFVDNAITKRLLAVNGVAQVGRNGGANREIRVELDPARMQALGVTAVQVSQQLRTLNLDAPGGRAQLGGGEQSIRVLGGAKTAEQLGATQIALSDGRVVRLDDLADVRDGAAEQRSLSRFNGRPATTFGVFKARGSSDVTVLENVEKELAKILKEEPRVAFKMVFTTVEYTKETYQSAINALIEGSILAVVVVFFFLRDWRATAISALAIPLSAIPTFAFMWFMDFTLNQVTLLSLSLVAGVLVDDAIVEIENIVRHMRMGKSGYQAALDAADEIGLAVVATSATIIAVFLPVSFMGGIVGQYFKQFGLTVAAAVFFSLLVARLITPVIAAYTLRPDSKVDAHGVDGPWMRRYMGWLRHAIEKRWWTIGAGIVIFAFSLVLLVLIPKAFVPASDLSSSQIRIELPPGVRIEETARVSAMVTELVRKHPEVTDVVESIGSDEDGQVRNASLYITLVPRSQRELSQVEWERKLAPELLTIPDARVQIQSQEGGGGLGRDITLFLTGDDPALVDRTARQVIREMEGLKEIKAPRINGDLPRPEIVIRPRLDLAAELGVTVQSISQTIRIATLGDIPQNAPKFSLSDRQIPIRVSLKENARQDIATIENLPVPVQGGGTVPLKSVAEIRFGEGPATVRRYNQSRRLALDADLNGVQLSQAMQAIENLPTMKNLPQGVRKVNVGSAEFMMEFVQNFLLALASGILMVFAVLVLLFARVFQPITILAALPLALAGAVLGLLVTGKPFSMPVGIGILMLIGIVGKNSILLVDFAIEEMRAGKDRLTALLESGHKRARPIIMTSVAMIAGMVPIAVGWHGDNAFRSPMAIAVIGGIITSTGLTLLIVPAVFTVIDDIERWFGPRASKLLSGGEHPPKLPPEMTGGAGPLPGPAAGGSPGRAPADRLR